MEIRIGIIPLPMYVLLLGIVAYFVAAKKIPTEVNMMIGVLALCGFTFAEIGNRLPLLRHIGGGAILATFLPSCLAYYHLIPAELVAAVTQFTESTNFLYLFVTAIIAGSVFGIDRTALMRGLKILIPLFTGSVLALIVGTTVGTLLGLGAKHTLLFVVVPVMAGGVGEGGLPLSVGYAATLHQGEGDLFAQVLPTIMFAGLAAILIAGALDYLGRKRPDLTGQGRLQPGEHDALDLREEATTGGLDVSQVAAAAVTGISLYLLGLVVQKVIGLPAPVVMLFLAMLLKLTSGVTSQLQRGSFFVYQFFAKAVTYPLLFAIGVAMTPWDKLIAALAPANLITIVATVATLIGSGFFVGRLVNLYPIDAAIVNATHCGQGGTGAVAILTAANRMQLMPFAQIATRIGGAITVTLTLLTLARFG
jgi:Na+/citrate or Na+/malate symporter